MLASEGSRAGRFWAAELGVGLAKLALLWKISLDGAPSTIYMGSRVYQTSDAGCGLADVCQRDAGDRALDIMAERLCLAIQRYVRLSWELS